MAMGSTSRGEHETAVDLDHRLVGHGAHRRVVEHEVTELAIRAAADAVDARNEREHAGARVVRPIRLRANARMQADGEHVDEHLAAAFRHRDSEVFVMRWHLERRNDGGFHGVFPWRGTPSVGRFASARAPAHSFVLQTNS